MKSRKTTLRRTQRPQPSNTLPFLVQQFLHLQDTGSTQGALEPSIQHLVPMAPCELILGHRVDGSAICVSMEKSLTLSEQGLISLWPQCLYQGSPECERFGSPGSWHPHPHVTSCPLATQGSLGKLRDRHDSCVDVSWLVEGGVGEGGAPRLRVFVRSIRSSGS